MVIHRVANIDEWDIAVCGLNCARCGIHQAYTTQDTAWQTRIGKDIFGDEATIDPAAIRCGRCRGDVSIHWSADCTLRRCAEAKGHRYCFQCDEFICDKLVDFAKTQTHHQRTVANLQEMKAIGVEAWVRKQQQKGPAVMCP